MSFFLVLNSSYSTRRHYSYNSYNFFFFILGLPFVLFFSFIYIIILTQQISQLLRCQFLISQNKIIKYETVTNMYFLVCSVCTFFFFNHRFVLFFLIYKSTNVRTVFLHFTSNVFALYIYNAILLSHFVFFFLFFFKVLNNSYNNKLI